MKLKKYFDSFASNLKKKVKKRHDTKGMTTKPILSKTFNSRAQVDLIDMQSLPDGEFRWLLVYQDHFTKFVVLKAKSDVPIFREKHGLN